MSSVEWNIQRRRVFFEICFPGLHKTIRSQIRATLQHIAQLPRITTHTIRAQRGRSSPCTTQRSMLNSFGAPRPIVRLGRLLFIVSFIPRTGSFFSCAGSWLQIASANGPPYRHLCQHTGATVQTRVAEAHKAHDLRRLSLKALTAPNALPKSSFTPSFTPWEARGQCR